MNPKSFFRLFSWLFDPNLYLKLFYINFRWLLVLQTWNNWFPLDWYLKFIDSKGRKDKKGQIFQHKKSYIRIQHKNIRNPPQPTFQCFSVIFRMTSEITLNVCLIFITLPRSPKMVLHGHLGCSDSPSLTHFISYFFHQIIWMSFLVCVILSKGKFMSYRKCFPSVYQTAMQQNVISFTIICFGEMSGIKVFPHKTIRNKKKELNSHKSE